MCAYKSNVLQKDRKHRLQKNVSVLSIYWGETTNLCCTVHTDSYTFPCKYC